MTPPQAQRLLQPLEGQLGLAAVEEVPPVAGRLDKTAAVHVLRLDLQDITGILGYEQAGGCPRRTVRLQDASELRHVGLQRGHGRWGRGVAPQQIDEPVHRHGAAAFDQEDRQELALQPRAQVEKTAIQMGLELSQVTERQPTLLVRGRGAG